MMKNLARSIGLAMFLVVNNVVLLVLYLYKIVAVKLANGAHRAYNKVLRKSEQVTTSLRYLTMWEL